MHPFFSFSSTTPLNRPLAWLAFAACITACSSRPTISVPNAIKPYKSEIVQGNFVSNEQVAALRTGMPKNQVRSILGTPLLTDVFHPHRWDYIFTIERDGVISKALRLTAYFNDETLVRWESDAMPNEAEFVNSLSSGRKIGKIPPLTASDKELTEFATRENSKVKISPTNNEATPAPSNKTYPPLEPK